ncbi:US12 family protein [Cellulosimicrobium terreum]|nr:US12 family protein [Cellulosimicrobium terreum]
MTDHSTHPPLGAPEVAPRDAAAVGTATLLGEVMALVAVAVGAATLGAAVGRELSPGTGLLLTIVAVGMLLLQSFGGARFRAGGFAVLWLTAVALVLGLGLGPTVAYYASLDPGAITEAASVTALVVAAVAATGLAIGRDLAGWLRVLSVVVLGVVVIGCVLLLVGSGGSPLLSLAIAVVSALLLLVDFNYLRRHGTKDDAVLLATGIFVSIVNLFVALLDLVDRGR